MLFKLYVLTDSVCMSGDFGYIVPKLFNLTPETKHIYLFSTSETPAVLTKIGDSVMW